MRVNLTFVEKSQTEQKMVSSSRLCLGSVTNKDTSEDKGLEKRIKCCVQITEKNTHELVIIFKMSCAIKSS